ncbi:glycosyltransferase [Alkalihalobacillus deserti]|uniref:glycosyltransferase n=1 Tax=Alkalihalobacillus deserti TaxID=2879466 RepID=UPI001D13D31A|nr:glycosyltransferase [Alkalihalobacillus deserti]
MNDKKKVLVISYVFSPNNTVRAFVVYKALCKKYETNILYADFDHYSKKHITYDNSDYKSIHVPSYKKNLSIMRMVSTLIFGVKLNKEIKKLNPDLVYVIIPANSSGFFVSKLCNKLGIPCVVDVVDLHPESLPLNERLKTVGDFFGLYWWKKIREVTIKNANKVILECNYYKKIIKEVYLPKTTTVYLTKQSSTALTSYNALHNNSINILYLGSIGHIYDFESIIYICEELNKRNIDYKLHIIGDGVKRKWLIDKLKSKKLNFKYYGKIYNESEKQKIMEICDFGFNGFKKETSVGLSYKSIDYMDYGLALINSCKEDTWNLIEDYEAGINYNPDNLKTLVDEIATKSINDIIKMKKNSRVLFDKFFDKEIFEKNINNQIKDLL